MTQKTLRAASTEERASWLAAGATELSTAIRREPEALSQSTGLSAPMVEWGARTTLETMHEDALNALAEKARRAGGDSISSLSVILAGNLFTAAARAIVVPLLLGVPVVAKSSSREKLFPAMLHDALRVVDAQLATGLEVVAFEGGNVDEEAALIERSAATAVYGADETIDAIRERHPGAHLIPHGHGVSVAYCGPDALVQDHIDATIGALALDVCAYDQRGCLSPQIIFVAENGVLPLPELVARLAEEGLEPLSAELPRGPLPLDVGAAQAQWRGVAEVEGELVAGDDYAIAIRSQAPIRWSPGYRNVTVAPVDDPAEAVAAITSLGENLKCVGVDEGSSAALERALVSAPRLRAYTCPLGTMQTPPLDAPADGNPIWHGLLR